MSFLSLTSLAVMMVERGGGNEEGVRKIRVKGNLGALLVFYTSDPVLFNPPRYRASTFHASDSTKMASLRRLRPAVSAISSILPISRLHMSRRSLHLAPPFLLDDYIPRYHLISSVDAAKKRSLAYAHLRECNLCPRRCGVNRFEKTGVCLIGAETVKVNTVAPHFGEGRAKMSGGDIRQSQTGR
jgi:hypothetical protein